MDNKKDIFNLHLVRLFAALMVLAVHCAQHSGISFDIGARGVQLFFILSGFLAFYSWGE